MGKFIVEGGKRLKGEVDINGAKNSALPILAATVLNGNINIIHNVPNLSDTKCAIEILKYLGCKVEQNKKTVIIDSSNICRLGLPEDLTRKMRSSITFMGSLCSRFKEVEIYHPGGCELGKRPIDIHINSLKKLGVKFSFNNSGKIYANSSSIKGSEINLNFPSVGATQNIMLAAVLADGITMIKNAAQEPEIYDLQCFLNKMGARIVGAGSNTIIINGVKDLNSVEYSIMPDRIEAGTFLCAAAITGSELKLNNVIYPHVKPINSMLTKFGCIVYENNNSLIIKPPRYTVGVDKIITQPHPGFPTDMQPQIMALATCSEGRTYIYETIFEDRNKHAYELMKMGANIRVVNGNKFFVEGSKKLIGCNVKASDLRGGAALIVAALAAEGKTTISSSEHIIRGYEDIDKVLSSVGASISYTP